ncbi:MAG: hypothetical protein AAB592_03670 [Patescibacteria group bacterium]
MNKQIIQIKKYSPLIITGIFIIAIYFSPARLLLFFSGFFAIAVLLSALKKWEAKKVLLILSPIVTYPLFLFFADRGNILNLPFHWLKNLTIYIAIYALLYGLVFKNLWTWLAANKRKFSILALTIIAVTTLFYGSLVAECYVTSNAENGVRQEDISKCRLFNLYNPTGGRLSGSFSGIPDAMIKIPSQGVGFTSIVVMLTLIFFEGREYYEVKKKK